ncbi:MAG TPA: hypothetical protein VH092_00365 [Urbifossiella sp.]|nr:hypothetical protein [Urbifossiella sp.]
MGIDPRTTGAGRAARPRAGFRVRLLLGLAAAQSFLPAACRPNKHYDLIEAELRTRDRELAATRAQLEAARNLNRGYENQRPPEFPGAPPPAPTAGGAGVSIHEIAVGRGTGGVDDDGVPGDEALMVVVVPTDEDRSAVKIPARVTVAAWEISPQGLKQPIGTWDITPEQLRPTWRPGLLSTGYFIRLPWQTYPTSNRVRVAVRLTTLDNRAYEADRDITVRPMTGAQPRPATPAAAPGRELLLPGVPPTNVPSVIPPGGVEELPPPAGLNPPERGARLLPPR